MKRLMQPRNARKIARTIKVNFADTVVSFVLRYNACGIRARAESPRVHPLQSATIFHDLCILFAPPLPLPPPPRPYIRPTGWGGRGSAREKKL